VDEGVAVQVEFGFPRCQPDNLDIFPFHSRCPAGAQRFEGGFFGGKAGGVVDCGLARFPAVFDLTFCIYSVEKTIAEALEGAADPVILNDVDADAGDHQFLCYR